MKKFLLVVPIMLFAFLFNVNDASAREINISVKDSEGCEWKISGDVDISWTGSVNSYNLTVTNCHGDSWNFVGMASPGSGSGNENGNGASGMASVRSQINPSMFYAAESKTGKRLNPKQCQMLCEKVNEFAVAQ